ncbi:uncharacterized protein VDAG_01496 [Verticillium dahliae VdLs.17]|uniref:Uncharacterized protein n=1 Tax=Verticillium dahliae (strain VdLs.17 / ATCC MYA-4575 / FGSC 10137) TaxID=498257 RepID=G2WUM3_VERDV|nr:uncharacterized protein VDAG_01496 [Verticillium dahliae VdLs.17]EGY17814.1 hypothetical protein VDAG_01496 [Verticillium dahliae VdLs.17]
MATTAGTTGGVCSAAQPIKAMTKPRGRTTRRRSSAAGQRSSTTQRRRRWSSSSCPLRPTSAPSWLSRRASMSCGLMRRLTEAEKEPARERPSGSVATPRRDPPGDGEGGISQVRPLARL